MVVKTFFPIAFLLMFVFLTACGPSINQENFDRIQPGMAEMEVLNILGEPTESSSMAIGTLSGTTSTWEDEKGKITIQFVNGKVKVKNFKKYKDASS
ncbi:MAG: outer membrane protein assembly factor BamE [Gammaproteobacteria bacterium]|nr:outer membrane protein assembly factor BamE [Gammaproteobacteria bacterium]